MVQQSILTTHHNHTITPNIPRSNVVWNRTMPRKWKLLQPHSKLCKHNRGEYTMRSDNIGLDYGVGWLDPDLHDPSIIYSDDYEYEVDEFFDEYYMEEDI